VQQRDLVAIAPGNSQAVIGGGVIDHDHFTRGSRRTVTVVTALRQGAVDGLLYIVAIVVDRDHDGHPGRGRRFGVLDSLVQSDQFLDDRLPVEDLGIGPGSSRVVPPIGLDFPDRFI
jgi:hypothetical protein